MSTIHHRNVLFIGACAVIIAASMALFVCLLTGITLLGQREDREEGEATVSATGVPVPTESVAALAASPTQGGTPFFLATPTVAPTFTPLVLNNPVSAPPVALVPTHNGVYQLRPAPSYQIIIAKRRGDSLFILNQTPDRVLALAPLQLGNDTGTISGGEWGLDSLAPGTCVTVWAEGGDPQPPDVECIQIGPTLTRPDRFWDQPFTVTYNGVLLGECPGERCLFHMTF